MSTLVFLEHHGNELLKSSLGVLSKAASLGDEELAGVVAGSDVRALAEEAGKFGAAKVYVAEDAQLEAPLPQARVDVLAQLVREPASPASSACTPRSESESVSCGFFFAPMIPLSDG
jgi:electron transfer flavoprotein alpha subunit